MHPFVNYLKKNKIELTENNSLVKEEKEFKHNWYFLISRYGINCINGNKKDKNFTYLGYFKDLDIPIYKNSNMDDDIVVTHRIILAENNFSVVSCITKDYTYINVLNNFRDPKKLFNYYVNPRYYSRCPCENIKTKVNFGQVTSKCIEIKIKEFLDKLSVYIDYRFDNGIHKLEFMDTTIEIGTTRFDNKGIGFMVLEYIDTGIYIDLISLPKNKEANVYWLSKLIRDLTFDEIKLLLKLIDELKEIIKNM